MSAFTIDEGRWYTLPDGTKLPSVTTILRRLHSFPLEQWKMAKVAQYVAQDPELHALAFTDGYAAAKQALQRGPNVGSAIHGATEMIDARFQGRPPDDIGHAVEGMPEILAYQTQGYADAMMAHQVRMVRSEITVVNTTIGYAGRFDRIIQVKSEGDTSYLADVKTSRAVYPEVGMQLAAYANAEYILKDGALEPMEKVDLLKAFVIHVTKERTDLVPVDIEEAWFAFQGLMITVTWQDGTAKRVVGKALTPPPLDPAVVARARERQQAKIAAAVERMKGEETSQPSPPSIYAEIVGEDATPELLASMRDLAVRLKDFLRDEFRAMPENVRKEVLMFWPAGIRGFKAARESGYEYALEELDAIESVLVRVAGKHQLAFPCELRPSIGTMTPKPAEKLAEKPAPKKKATKVAAKKPLKPLNRVGRCVVCAMDASTINEKGEPQHPNCLT